MDDALPAFTRLITRLDNRTRLLFHDDLRLVLVERDGALLSAFCPQRPELLPPSYIAPIAEMAYVAHRAHGGHVLHLGGAGMTAARALETVGIGGTVVDIDEALCRALLERYPVGPGVRVVYGDARDWVAELAPVHPTVIVDMGSGAFGEPEIDLAEAVIDLVHTARAATAGSPTTVLVNLHLATDDLCESRAGRVSDRLSDLGPVARFDGGSDDGARHNTLLMASDHAVMRRILAGCELPRWSRVT
ncbi:MAG: hypothetical protein H6523_15170 [Mycolicibacterium sp.]|nr:hypothetical protein [Mycolicibacterium sp.]